MKINVFIELLDRILPDTNRAALPVVGLRGETVVQAGAPLGVHELDAMRRLGIDKVFVDMPVHPSAEQMPSKVWMPFDDWVRLVHTVRFIYSEAAADRFAKAQLEEAADAVINMALVRLAVSGAPALPIPYRTLPSEVQPYGHAANTAIWAAHAAVRLGLPPDELADAAMGCLLHDIGKMLSADHDGHQTAAYMFLRRQFPSASRVPGIVLLYPNVMRASARQLSQDRSSIDAARLCYLCNLYDKLSDVSAYRYEGALDILRTLPDRALVAREAAALAVFVRECLAGTNAAEQTSASGTYWMI